MCSHTQGRRERVGIDELNCSILVDICVRCGRYVPVHVVTEEQYKWLSIRNKNIEEWNTQHGIKNCR